MTSFLLFQYRFWRFLFIGGLFWIVGTLLCAQNVRTKTFLMATDSLQIDTLSIVPKTLHLQYKNAQLTSSIDTNDYRLEWASARLFWLKKPLPTDSIMVTYRCFPFLWQESKTHKSPQQILHRQNDYSAYYQYQIKKERELDEQIWDKQSGLQYSGSFGRSISVGNNQDLSADANFNLQLSGKITEDIEVLGAITDNNIPFQPEGNTQQLQDFDRIFVQIKRKKTSVLLGDYDLKNTQQNYFSRYNRRLQGAQVQHEQNLGSKDRNLKIMASGAAAKGNFSRQTFNGIEGNQGPYKLNGNNGETFIMVLAGSERAFIDGQLLTRGYDNDYVIDYNTAEIVFTPRQIMTANKRIVIEFQYADRNYLRATIAANIRYESPKWTFFTDFFAEKDAKNQPLVNGSLSDEQINVLKQVGDSLSQALVLAIDTVTFAVDSRIYYRLADTIVYGIPFVFLEQSNNPDSAKFIATFSFVGKGRGFYELSNTSTNGRIYRWLPPDEQGNLQGSYAPVTPLVTPKSKLLWSAGGQWQPTKNQKVFVQAALSQQDPNTFSDIGNSDNGGVATWAGYENTVSLNKQIQLQIGGQYEWRQKNFLPLEIYRNVEFVRDWSLQNNTFAPANEHLGNAFVQIQNPQNNWQLRYKIGLLQREQHQYEGIQHQLSYQYKHKGWQIVSQNSWLKANNFVAQNSSEFLRPNAAVSKTFSIRKKANCEIGAKAEMEQNRIWLATDSLSRQAFYFYRWEVFNNWVIDSAKSRQIQLRYEQRQDHTPQQQRFSPNIFSQEANLQINWALNPNNQYNFRGTYRRVAVADTLTTTQRNLNNFLAELNQTAVRWKGLVRQTMQYQLNNGQRQITQIYYQKTEPGRGNYVWQDANQNGIEEIEEFLPAGINDVLRANYVQLALPTNTYEPTRQLQISYSLAIQPKALWQKNKGWQKIVAYWSLQSTMQNRREFQQKGATFWNFVPLVTNLLPIADSLLVSANTTTRHTLYFNRNGAKYESSLYWFRNLNKNLLVTGSTARQKNEYGTTHKISFDRKFTLDLTALMGSNSSIFMPNTAQNFVIRYYQATPVLSYMPTKNWKLALNYSFKYSYDTLLTDRKIAQTHQIAVDTRFGSAAKRSVSVRFSWAQVSYSGDNNSAAAYTLLEGLRTGSNFLWNISYDTRLSNNMQLNIIYDGRKAGSNKMSNVGRMGIRAVF
jgi:hypothetical protein